MTTARKNPHAVALGRKGGKSTSPAKAAASRANGAKGGRQSKLGGRPMGLGLGSPNSQKIQTI